MQAFKDGWTTFKGYKLTLAVSARDREGLLFVSHTVRINDSEPPLMSYIKALKETGMDMRALTHIEKGWINVNGNRVEKPVINYHFSERSCHSHGNQETNMKGDPITPIIMPPSFFLLPFGPVEYNFKVTLMKPGFCSSCWGERGICKGKCIFHKRCKMCFDKNPPQGHACLMFQEESQKPDWGAIKVAQKVHQSEEVQDKKALDHLESMEQRLAKRRKMKEEAEMQQDL